MSSDETASRGLKVHTGSVEQLASVCREDRREYADIDVFDRWEHPMRRGIRSVAVAALTTAVAASAPAPRASAAADGDWTTYHHDNARSGVAAGLAPLGALSRAWTATLDGAVYGQPLAVGDRIFAATENDT